MCERENTAGASGASRLRAAVRAAGRAYKKTGRMLDAALAYAAHGFPVFPLTTRKTPVPPRDKDADGKKIPGTGSFYKASTDPLVIHGWWYHAQYLIGLPMGAASGVWALDIDTSEDHADGIAEWKKIVAQHEPIKTREHRSATGGPHLIFNYDPELPLGCSSGALPAGIDVKGRGGYIVVPPSRRKGRAYTVHNDIDPVDAPLWLTDLILQGRKPTPDQSSGPRADGGGDPSIDIDELTDAMQFVPNNDLSWDEWTAIGLAIYASVGYHQGFALFDAFSQKSDKYDPDETRKRWDGIDGSPPNRTGVNKLYKIARENGWVQKLRPAAASNPLENFTNLDVARRTVEKLAYRFLYYEVAIPERLSDPWTDFGFAKIVDWPAPTQAFRVTTGVGKTQIVIREIAKWLNAGHVDRPVIYAVPRHQLGEKIKQQFTDHGISAKVFRGRNAKDPENDGRRMCINLKAVELAMKCHANISETCCKRDKKKCRHFDRCGYQRQMEGDPPAVWIVASDILFHRQKAFEKPIALIIDESFWRKGLRGVEEKPQGVKFGELISPKPIEVFDDLGCRNSDRDFLGRALQKLDAGPINRARFLEAFAEIGNVSDCIRREWKCQPELGQHPSMSPEQLKRLEVNEGDTIEEIDLTRRTIRIWQEIDRLIKNPDMQVSGRLSIGDAKVLWRGVDEIVTQFQVPTLLLDATLPNRSLLEIYHPHVKIVADINCAMPPHVRIRQFLRTPTSSNKLDSEKHLEAVRRAILQRWFETGRQPALVICQMKVEEWLLGKLPDNIAVEHYNNIAGLDQYKDVRLLMLVGRVAPGPEAVEAHAGALTGIMPKLTATNSGGFRWFEAVKRGIRLRDGSGVATTCDFHPDPVAEAVRWQIHEAELIQALGRARGVNRTAETPLDVDLLLDTCLPVTVDAVEAWQRPSLLIAAAAEGGVMLTNPKDMVKLWPDLWPNDNAADRCLKGGVPSLPGFVPVKYQLAGPKQKHRTAMIDPAAVPDPTAWLQERLGPLRKKSL